MLTTPSHVYKHAQDGDDGEPPLPLLFTQRLPGGSTFSKVAHCPEQLLKSLTILIARSSRLSWATDHIQSAIAAIVEQKGEQTPASDVLYFNVNA